MKHTQQVSELRMEDFYAQKKKQQQTRPLFHFSSTCLHQNIKERHFKFAINSRSSRYKVFDSLFPYFNALAKIISIKQVSV